MWNGKAAILKPNAAQHQQAGRAAAAGRPRRARCAIVAQIGACRSRRTRTRARRPAPPRRRAHQEELERRLDRPRLALEETGQARRAGSTSARRPRTEAPARGPRPAPACRAARPGSARGTRRPAGRSAPAQRRARPRTPDEGRQAGRAAWRTWPARPATNTPPKSGAAGVDDERRARRGRRGRPRRPRRSRAPIARPGEEPRRNTSRASAAHLRARAPAASRQHAEPVEQRHVAGSTGESASPGTRPKSRMAATGRPGSPTPVPRASGRWPSTCGPATAGPRRSAWPRAARRSR